MDSSYWNERFASTRYRFVRVSRSTGYETEVLSFLHGGTITRNNDTRILETAEASVVDGLDVGADLVRIYLTATWADGTEADVALGTFLPSVPSRDVKGPYSTSTVKMNGRLTELYEDMYASPVTLAKGTNAVEACVSVIEEAGLEVVADPSDYTISRVRTYGAGAQTNDSDIGDTKLDMVNDLLGLAGFSQAMTDAYGRVLLKKYVQPSERAQAWSFTEGANAKFLIDMTDERDTTSVANRVVVVYSSDDGDVIGVATDDDPDSEFSTVTQGRTITTRYDYTDLPDGTAEEQQAVADRKAANLLATAQSVIRRVTLTHTYCPVGITDAVGIAYATGAVQGDFTVRTQKISLVGGCPVEAEVRQFTRG